MGVIKNKYKILNKISKGDIGEVYKGKNIQNNQIVAIKLIKNCNLTIKNYKREIDNLLVVKGVENFVQYIESIIDGDNCYIIMELLDGYTTLKDIVNKLDNEQKEYIKIEITKIISHLHDLGYSHNDLNSKNIMIGNDLSVKVIDLGLMFKIENEYDLYMDIFKLSSIYNLLDDKKIGLWD